MLKILPMNHLRGISPELKQNYASEIKKKLFAFLFGCVPFELSGRIC